MNVESTTSPPPTREPAPAAGEPAPVRLFYERARDYARWRLKFLRLRVCSLPFAWRELPAYADLRSFCCFVGAPRSGHSIVAAFLDAHPDAVIADELNALHSVESGFTRGQILRLILENSRRMARAGRPGGTYYRYLVPGQWQGRYRALRVVGDKHGPTAVEAIGRCPELIERTRRRLRLPVKLLHVVRNPFDNITTWAFRRRWPLERVIKEYFAIGENVQRILRSLSPQDSLVIRHEKFIENPRSELKRICDFLGLESAPDYLEACASITYSAPHRSRFECAWPPRMIDQVREQARAFPHLEAYSYHE